MSDWNHLDAETQDCYETAFIKTRHQFHSSSVTLKLVLIKSLMDGFHKLLIAEFGIIFPNVPPPISVNSALRIGDVTSVDDEMFAI